MTTTYTIKCTSKMSNGMKLSGNVLSDDTYGLREYIKMHWDGKWDASRKVWFVNVDKVISTINGQAWGFTKVLSIDKSVTSPIVEKVHGINGWCNKCHTYCYGDCQAN